MTKLTFRPMIRSMLVVGSTFGSAFMPIGTSAAAQAPAQEPACAPHPELVRALAKDYGERLVSVGLTNTGALMEVLASADGATWSVLITQVSGLSCMVLSGSSWMAEPSPSTRAAILRN